MFYTSWYGDKSLDKNSAIFPISLGLPKFATPYPLQRQIAAMAPTYDMLRMEKAQYEKHYKQLLSQRRGAIMEIIRGIEQGARGRDIVFCCFEDIRSGEKWCHRTMLAGWLGENLQKQVDEWAKLRNTFVVERKPQQLSLF